MMSTLRLLAAIAMIAATVSAYAQEAPSGQKGWYAEWYDTATENVTRAWNEGRDEVLIPTYTWHLPFAYTREKIDGYQNYPIGIGYGRSRFDERGNSHEVYALGFQDSHFKPEWLVGYAWKTYWPLGGDFKGGLGFTAGVTMREDLFNYFPVPVIFPMGSIANGRWSLETAYVPGGKGNGNILFFLNKWRFDAK